MIILYLILIPIIVLLIWLGLRKKWKLLIWTVITIVVLILIGGFIFLRIIGEAFGADCEKSRIWRIGEYTIQEYRCLGWAGPYYYPADLYKNNKRIDESKYLKDSCYFTFRPEKDLYINFDVCNKLIAEIRPDKQLIDLNDVDSIIMISNVNLELKKLSEYQSSKFIKDWNKSEVSDYRNKHKDSLFYPNFKYRIIVYQTISIKEFTTRNQLIGDASKWTYYMTNDSNLEYFDRLWEN